MRNLWRDMVEFADLQSASFDTPKLWTKDGSTKSLIDITDYQNNSVTQISCKTNSLTESLRHAKWTGAMARLWSKVDVCSLQTRGWSFLANACFHTMLAGALGWCACSRTTGATVRTRGQCLAWDRSRDRTGVQVWCCSCFLLDP